MKTVITFLTTLFFLLTTHAQVFVKQDATGNNDGTSWQNAYTDLQDAFNNANTNDHIWIAAGIFNSMPDSNGYVVNKPLEIYGGFIGTELMAAERNWQTNITTLSGDIAGNDVEDDFENFRKDNARHVLRIFNQSGVTLVDGLTISGGNARTDEIPMSTVDYSPWRGGGIEIIADAKIQNCRITQCNGNAGSALWTISNQMGSNVILENSIIEKNSSIQGAVVFLFMEDPVVRSCQFKNNFAVSYGAGITFGNTNALVEDCIFQSNSVPDLIGGGVFIFQNSGNIIPFPTIELRRNEFIDNLALAGAGICFNNFYPGSEIIIDSCNFFLNISPANIQGGGGGILLQNFPDSFGGGIPSLSGTISNCTLKGNSADDGAGAYFYCNSDTMDIAILNSEFSDNSGNGSGGGIYMTNDEAFINFELQNCDFDKNTSGFSGGAIGIVNNNDGSRLKYKIEECTFTDNQAEYCGALWSTIYSFEDLGSIGTISNSEFVNNATTQCCGAIGSVSEDLTIDNSIFANNFTNGLDETLPGGGGVYLRYTKNATISNSIFTENKSEADGSAIMIQEGDRIRLENVLLYENEGTSTISNEDSLWMVNVTMADNETGVLQKDGGYLELQNNIFSNLNENYLQPNGSATVISKGGNARNDNSMDSHLVGYGGYKDLIIKFPQLDSDFVPVHNSVAVDNGNPEGIITDIDLAGESRIQGNQIDAGAFESPFLLALDSEDIEKLNIKIYPNPFIDHIVISKIEEINGIRLLDVLGKEVQRFSVENELSIQKDLPKGIYFLELEVEGQRLLKKLKHH